MSNRVKMSDVAVAAGASSMTVSRAFESKASVDRNTRKKSSESPTNSAIPLTPAPSNLRSLRTDFVALTMPTINNPSFAETVDALSLELADDGLQPLIDYYHYDTKVEE